MQAFCKLTVQLLATSLGSSLVKVTYTHVTWQRPSIDCQKHSSNPFKLSSRRLPCCNLRLIWQIVFQEDGKALGMVESMWSFLPYTDDGVTAPSMSVNQQIAHCVWQRFMKPTLLNFLPWEIQKISCSHCQSLLGLSLLLCTHLHLRSEALTTRSCPCHYISLSLSRSISIYLTNILSHTYRSVSLLPSKVQWQLRPMIQVKTLICAQDQPREDSRDQ